MLTGAEWEAGKGEGLKRHHSPWAGAGQRNFEGGHSWVALEWMSSSWWDNELTHHPSPLLKTSFHFLFPKQLKDVLRKKKPAHQTLIAAVHPAGACTCTCSTVFCLSSRKECSCMHFDLPHAFLHFLHCEDFLKWKLAFHLRRWKEVSSLASLLSNVVQMLSLENWTGSFNSYFMFSMLEITGQLWNVNEAVDLSWRVLEFSSATHKVLGDLAPFLSSNCYLVCSG